jgi:hypothetical protein
VLADLEEVRSHLAAIDTKIELYESRLSRPQRRSA